MALSVTIRRVLLGLGVFCALVMLGVATLLWTAPGYSAVEWLVGRVAGGSLTIEVLGGRLPGHPTMRKVEFRDKKGIWLRLDNVTLSWSAWDLLFSHISVEAISASQVEWLRRPLPSETTSTTTPRIDIAAAHLPQIDIAPAVMGQAARLAAQGALHYRSRHDVTADLSVVRAGSADRYRLQGGIQGDVAIGSAVIAESGSGLLGRLLGLPGLGAIRLEARAGGDAAANRLSLLLTAGALRFQGGGTISLADRRADLDFAGGSPAMALNDMLGWKSLAVEGQLHGKFDRPQLQAKFVVEDFHAGDAAAARIEADAHGAEGRVEATAVASGLRLPGRVGATFAASPARLRLNADLTKPARPVSFSLVHPMVAMEGRASFGAAPDANAHLTIPDLAPFAAIFGADLGGKAQFDASARGASPLSVQMRGRLQTQGSAILARMLGSDAQLAMSGQIAGQDIDAIHVNLNAAGARGDVSGSLRKGRMNLRFAVGLPDLARLNAMLRGRADAAGTLSGIGDKALWDIGGSVSAATTGFKPQPVALHLRMTGLNPSAAQASADGHFNGAPLALHLTMQPQNGQRRVDLSAGWRTAKLQAHLLLDGRPVSGELHLDEGDLRDVGAFAGPLGGSVHLTVILKPSGQGQTAQIDGTMANIAAQGVTAEALAVKGIIENPFDAPQADLSLHASRFAAYGVSGEGTASLRGPAAAMALAMDAKISGPGCATGTMAVSALGNLPAAQLRFTKARLDWCGAAATLTRPANLDLAKGVAIEGLALTALGGTITVDGQVMPNLALRAAAEGLSAEALSRFMPQVSAAGTIGLHATLSGTVGRPQGEVTFTGRDLRPRIYSFQGGTAVNLDGRAELQGEVASLDATARAGTAGALRLSGTVPLAPNGSIKLHLEGSSDLQLLNPFLAPQGRQAKGRLTLNTDAGGPLTRPLLSGFATLSDGEINDYARGVHLTAITARLEGAGAALRLTSLTATAGSGRITGHGSIDIGAAQMPVDTDFTFDNARPVASNEIDAAISGRAKLAGALFGKLTLSGDIAIPRANINLPDSFPPEVASLHVRRRGVPAPVSTPSATPLALDIALRSTGPILLRGHGIDARLGGDLHIGGTSNVPVVSGGFQVQHGTFSIAGQSLEFTSGRIGFDGEGLSGRIDPSLDLVASETAGGITATVTVTGYASRPRIVLSSTPDLPQDEILAHLLFQQSAAHLTPFQMAQAAQTLASMSGVEGDFNPVSSLRSSLGLDRFAIGSDAGGATTVETGKYISHNMYIGGRQSSGGQTQVQVRIDLAKNLTAEAIVNAGTPATATQGTAGRDNGSSIGLSYQFEY